ncbi:MAG: amidohydrolase [Chitinophagaceae bacterium]|nr:amidohydrolase [Chitinophagaceae bacterium]
MKSFLLVLFCMGICLNSFGQSGKNIPKNTSKKDIFIENIDRNSTKYGEIAKRIWDYAEVGYKEVKSSEELKQLLKSEGFNIEEGVAGIPTAFIATYKSGTGVPTVAVLGEYDALPGISQEAVTERKPILQKEAGHACGHHLFGVASAAASIALKQWLIESKANGTIKFYGTPAEEGGSGKVYMVREGLFKGVDIVLHWHPGSMNSASPSTSLANRNGKFRFYGTSAHAAASPERGRSALDGVEAMNMMVNMMREHTKEDSRIHYIITRGGEAPNVVPDFAEVYYYVRHKSNDEVRDMWKRLENAAKGAAMGTDTEVKIEILGGVYSTLPNEVLSKAMYENLKKVGGYTYTEEEKIFAEKIYTTLGKSAQPLENTNKIQPYESREGKGSTDVGDISWNVPTVGLNTATWVPGTAAHSWQAVAAGGTSIGTKGLLIAAKTIALTGYDIFTNTQLIEDAWKELRSKQGESFKYEPLLGDRKPALDYRD